MRLTKDLRDNIVREIKKIAFDHKWAVLRTKEHDIAMQLHQMHYPKDWHQLAQSLPKHACVEVSSYRYWDNVYGSIVVRFEENKRPLALYNTYNYRVDNWEDSPDKDKAIALLRSFDKESTALSEEQDELLTHARGVLESVTTVKKLKEQWEEIAPIVDKVLGTQTPTSKPANMLSTINYLNTVIPLPQ